ncbi:voltage-dependent calcium channel subunit alpha-2/delta-3 isoform X4 [Thrips palmi]|uniref:Voltage-dependent calcium channel subunit alpha-2/delta-3 isoform X4 n=1 Tax=Thrips palmi TaxID=161013 RepID=A0A6P8YL71_THRPL|nr:voltage-dependent calcium channel subunit alpha-2/delta-3 isoform X4 [Thrips palmi]
MVTWPAAFTLLILALLPSLVLLIKYDAETADRQESIRNVVVQTWAEKLGLELWNFGEHVTRRKEVQESYKAATVEPREGGKLLDEIAQDIENMMLLKISAVKRIMDAAQEMAMSAPDEVVNDFPYFNAKQLVNPGSVGETENGNGNGFVYGNGFYGEPPSLSERPQEMLLTPNKHFSNIPVNTSLSAVHVPTNVYDGAPEVMRAIKWSQDLDRIFIHNYRGDPFLSWQYFGSSSGFMRQFPAMQWKQDPVDLYDCRTRSWYIEAAASPKDVLILVDNSGSMTGMRREIARHVVNNILDTLGNNDFVNILTFADDVMEVVPCFKETLVQANLANIRELKMGMEDMETNSIANFSLALTRAFDILQMYRGARLGACCNQAIMLITDGVPYNFKEIFEEYNWRSMQPEGFMPVRVFTYLIGREVADVREVKWMACANRGYYVHLSTLAEVREQVLHYVPVMARPLVLGRVEHPIIWTPVYADVTDPKMTDWLWEVRESSEQKKIFQNYRKDKQGFLMKVDRDPRHFRKKNRNDPNSKYNDYQLMTSVSMPVYDLRENANITERVLINEAYWVTETRETRVANLLGVAGTDVPIQEIQRLMNAHKLGVNAYAFLVTNNGYILVHPDLRPTFGDILKPSYNAVDFAEVELVDDARRPRELDPVLTQLRDDLVNQNNGSKYIDVKYHYDDMRRIGLVRRHYYYRPLLNFSLAIAVPEPYGKHRVRAELEIHRVHIEGKHNVMDYFKGKNWKVHPDWDYCKYLYEAEHSFETPEAELMHFLNKTGRSGWKWLTKRNFPSPEHAGNTSGTPFNKDHYFCDRSLFQSLVMDAKVTEWFNNNLAAPSDKGALALLLLLLPRKEYQARYGFCIAFMATHSGLTRWIDFHANEANVHDDQHFSEIHNRAIDELWYQRAVEQFEESNSSFVYSVPHQESGYKNGTLVTASHAVFHYDSHKGTRAPAAVVGFQVQHSALHTLFTNITSTASPQLCGGKKCKTCESNEVDCFVLDNHGFVVVSEELAHTGRFFGEIRGAIMEMLVRENMYRRITVYDYQAVCFRPDGQISAGPRRAVTPWMHLKMLAHWLFTALIWLGTHTMAQAGALMQVSRDQEADYTDADIAYDNAPDPTVPNGLEDKVTKVPMERLFQKLLINRTRPQPCDQQVDLFLLANTSDKGGGGGPRGIHMPMAGCERPFVAHSIPHSNLLLLVVDALCPQVEHEVTLIPQEVLYNSSLSCFKVGSSWDLNRKKPRSCFNHHPKEREIELCGRGAFQGANLLLSICLALVTLCIGAGHSLLRLL